MCTLLIGRGIPDPGTVLIAANRDEDPARPSDPPRVLRERPRVVGGRDRVAGGTWLAVRERDAAVAMLNRRPAGPADPARPVRSRGLLALEVAGVTRGESESLAEVALAEALRLLGAARYSAFSMAFLSPEACWLLAHWGDAAPAVTEITPGWHALTHADLDDSSEPRTAWLLRTLRGFQPRTVDEAVERLGELLRTHQGATRDEPAVCIHTGRMVTVSSSIVVLGRSPRYLHAEGRPCEQPIRDLADLIAGAPREIGLA